MRDSTSALCGEPFPSSTASGLTCALIRDHDGSHDAGVFTWPRDASDGGRCGITFRDHDARHQICNVIAGHIGSHQSIGAAAPAPFTPCGEKVTWYEPGTEPCALRAGHRGLHASGPGDYIGGRTTEDVLVEAFQRISELETRLSTLTGISEQGTNAPVPVTHGDLNHAMVRLEESVTGRLSGIGSLIRDVSTKVSQLHVMPQQCDGYFGPAEDAELWQCTRAAGHDGWHSDADSGSLWDDSGAFLEAPAGEPPRGVCGAVRSFNGVDHVCQMDPGHVGLHRDAAEYVNALLVWNAQGAWPDPSA